MDTVVTVAVGLVNTLTAGEAYGHSYAPPDGPDLRRSGVVRAQAMAYRDQRGDAITDADWGRIEDELRTAYGLRRANIPPPK